MSHRLASVLLTIQYFVFDAVFRAYVGKLVNGVSFLVAPMLVDGLATTLCY